MMRRVPVSVCRTREPPAASSRSRMPRNPLPSGAEAPRPSSAISSLHTLLIPHQADDAVLSLGMANDIGNRLAQSERQH